MSWGERLVVGACCGARGQPALSVRCPDNGQAVGEKSCSCSRSPRRVNSLELEPGASQHGRAAGRISRANSGCQRGQALLGDGARWLGPSCSTASAGAPGTAPGWPCPCPCPQPHLRGPDAWLLRLDRLPGRLAPAPGPATRTPGSCAWTGYPDAWLLRLAPAPGPATRTPGSCAWTGYPDAWLLCLAWAPGRLAPVPGLGARTPGSRAWTGYPDAWLLCLAWLPGCLRDPSQVADPRPRCSLWLRRAPRSHTTAPMGPSLLHPTPSSAGPRSPAPGSGCGPGRAGRGRCSLADPRPGPARGSVGAGGGGERSPRVAAPHRGPGRRPEAPAMGAGAAAALDSRRLNETLQRLLCGAGNGNASGWNRSVCDPLRGPPGLPAPADLTFATRVLLYGLIFLLSVGGNALVVGVLALNRRLRTVTNSFLLSLALSDLLLALCCMPFSLLPSLMGTFVFGTPVCKLMAYLMGVSVSVSTFSLVAIAMERYSAICTPLQARAWQTRSHAARVIAGTWLLALLLMVPYAVYSTTKPLSVQPGLRQCLHRWPSPRFTQAWYILLLLVLFFIPGVVMAVAYGLISRELYRSIRFEMGPKSEAKALSSPLSPALQPSGAEALGAEEDDGCYVPVARPGRALALSALGRGAAGGPQQDRARVNGSQAQLLAKKRVIRMLVVIVAMFFFCWLPLFSANTWRAFAPASAQQALSGAPISFIHLLSYTSACANPLIYCFMNRRFRAACAATCARCCARCPRPRPPPPDGDLPTASASLSRASYATVSSLAP
ncbi:gastrin/cholecystokinin type B receptor [Carettochelys insculpta]|uniref:gastrin/cholecystokinin type B receptor n=1 Tax=Carettochelys insculpta TaxID=44489 RepID=UPI003EC02583